MNNSIKFVLSILMLACVCIAGTAQAIEKKTSTTPPARLKKQYDNVLVPLTKAECLQLGGSVLSNAGTGVCNSGKFCHTTDQNGANHNVCISQ